MNTNPFFTEEEKQMLIPLYRKLLQLSGDTLSPGDCRKLKAHLVACAASNGLQRDVFGLNPVIKDMHPDYSTVAWFCRSRKRDFVTETGLSCQTA